MHKKDIKNFTAKELEEALIEIEEPSYRARQIFFWLYRRGINDFNEMGNIPRTLKAKLKERYYIGVLTPSERLKSADGTEKIIFKLADGHFIETVLIHAGRRKTVCLSTQVGCKFGCAFCASGRRGFIRDLTIAEIINQTLYLRYSLKCRITNYVFMGMGEPLDNYENTVKAIIIMNDPMGMDIGAGRITVSTCGIIPGIEKLKELKLRVNLSVSLHTADNKLRNALMPINRLYPLERLIKTCDGFIDKTGRVITLEYVLIKGVNVSAQDADAIAAIARRLKAKVNLIRYSEIPGLSFQSPQHRETNIFMKRLVDKGVKATLREEKGRDIQAACGQLAGRKKNEI